jgi:hypothetical protein
MTAATKVIGAGGVRAGWLEVSTGRHETLDDAIRLASFGISARHVLCWGLCWGLRNKDWLITGHAVPILGQDERAGSRVCLGHTLDLRKGDRGHTHEEHEAHCESFQIPLLSDAVPLWLGADTSRGGIVCNKVGILSILRCENLVMFQRRSYWIPGS